MNNSSGSITDTYTFDSFGNTTASSGSAYAFLTGRNFTTAYGYDAASNRTSFTDPESGVTTYVYDTLNRLATLTVPPAIVPSGNFTFGYDVLSRRTGLNRPNAVNTTYSYDNLSRLLSVTHKKGATTLDGATYTVDNAGNRLSALNSSGWAYNSSNELTSRPGVTYTYDNNGDKLW